MATSTLHNLLAYVAQMHTHVPVVWASLETPAQTYTAFQSLLYLIETCFLWSGPSLSSVCTIYAGEMDILINAHHHERVLIKTITHSTETHASPLTCSWRSGISFPVEAISCTGSKFACEWWQQTWSTPCISRLIFREFPRNFLLSRHHPMVICFCLAALWEWSLGFQLFVGDVEPGEG